MRVIHRWMRYSIMIVALALGVSLTPWPAPGAETAGPHDAPGAQTAGMITEIKNGGGRIEVRAAGGGAWLPAAPLQALRPGDAVRASANAWAVLVLSGGRGNVKVDGAGSPFVVPAPPSGGGQAQKALGLLESSVRYLSTGAKEPLQAVLSTRSASRPPVILSPRNGPILPESLTFEWLGSRFSRYTLRLAGPAGAVWERAGVVGARFDYPPDAPPLSPGVRYTVQVVGVNHPPQAAWFELVDPTRAQAVRRDLAELGQAIGPTAAPNTAAVLQAGFLAGSGLLHDARLVVIAALAKDPDEPTLHLLLANLYSRTGLSDLAAESYDEAQFLMGRGAGEPPSEKR